MKLKQLLKSPIFIPKEMGDEDKMTPFFITDERLTERYKLLATKDEVEVYLNKDRSSACVGLRSKRHDGRSGIKIYGDLQFKDHLCLRYQIDQFGKAKILQVNLVSVVDESKFMGLGSFLYSSIVKAGNVIISDNKQFIGGKELWKKIGRSHLSNEVVYLIDKGNVMIDDKGKPIEYDGENVPDNKIWSEDKQKEFVLFLYKNK